MPTATRLRRCRSVAGLVCVALFALSGCSAGEPEPPEATPAPVSAAMPPPQVPEPAPEPEVVPDWLPVSTDAAQPGPAPEGWPWVRVLANGDVVPSDCDEHRDVEPSPHAKFEAWLDCVTSRGETEPSDSGMDEDGRVWSRGLVVYAHRDAPFAKVSVIVRLGLGRPVRVRRFYLAARSAAQGKLTFVDLTRPTDRLGRSKQELERMELLGCPVLTWVEVLKPDSGPVPGAHRRLRYYPWRTESLSETEVNLARWLDRRQAEWPLLLHARIDPEPYQWNEGATCAEWLGLLDAAWRAGFRAFTVS